jgi:hypothetical protein
MGQSLSPFFPSTPPVRAPCPGLDRPRIRAVSGPCPPPIRPLSGPCPAPVLARSQTWMQAILQALRSGCDMGFDEVTEVSRAEAIARCCNLRWALAPCSEGLGCCP